MAETYDCGGLFQFQRVGNSAAAAELSTQASHFPPRPHR
ncbi:hypothetical protein Rrhod_0622 [Rhodococcus rhodnii LMG 5362]|uniref:Uncharacterized protein n=1 Tax=Rhodococcus rhodnii LMG 5362 TaxID=1273125 RepID=R7WRK5_9NOCA|nr:hypothetical protein Rrhod_0622 [Rhodococcus rhodnii LMG 5362]